MQFATCAICNTCNLQHMQFAIRAIGKICNLQRMPIATRAWQISLMDQQDGSARRISWTDQLDKPADQTSWMDQPDGPAGQYSSLYLAPWSVRIFEDWPVSLYIVTGSESDEGLVFQTTISFWPKFFLDTTFLLDTTLILTLYFLD